ncbi:Spo11/DNA topoisomerase VI subunit A [Colletotrichum phormii]|uniref:DNA topoisomerase (ATP-hydrolyzing) n=1 Tax=Colletotrichum phormii TaxID=359342 RepID=A0AAI9ZTN4_9PEZI|nr:Spo11/DNA topoisomerase VI subunit A [Colletotrichum phormii]KAK1637656.1 Spo11/DNA topoisomerase VI subunit A [Colletotrichum phormii]
MDFATSPLLNGHQEGRLTAQLSNPSQPSTVVTIPDSDPNHNATGLAIVKLEDILIASRESLLQNREIVIPFRTRPSASRSANSCVPFRTTRSAVRFPGRTVEEATKFTRIMRIMQLSLSALTEGRLITKRNIYYQDTDLFKRQSTVDNLVDDLAYTLGLGREDLGIVAASKGLVSGPIILRSGTLSEVDASSSGDGILIPSVRSVSEIDFGPTQWILETSALGMGILVTGKGYPDLNTKQFVHLLHTAKPELPVFALVDFDCYGIAIMRCYSHGTRGHAHEKSTTVPSMQWLGIKSDDLPFHQNANPSPGSADGGGGQRRSGESTFESSSSLTLRDRTRAINMVREVSEDGTDIDRDCRRELQVMLFLGIKAEIQAVDNTGDMSRWLDGHMRSA